MNSRTFTLLLSVFAISLVMSFATHANAQIVTYYSSGYCCNSPVVSAPVVSAPVVAYRPVFRPFGGLFRPWGARRAFSAPVVTTYYGGSACCGTGCCGTACCGTSGYVTSYGLNCSCNGCGVCGACCSGNCATGDCATTTSASGTTTPTPDPNSSLTTPTQTFKSNSTEVDTNDNSDSNNYNESNTGGNNFEMPSNLNGNNTNAPKFGDEGYGNKSDGETNDSPTGLAPPVPNMPKEKKNPAPAGFPTESPFGGNGQLEPNELTVPEPVALTSTLEIKPIKSRYSRTSRFYIPLVARTVPNQGIVPPLPSEVQVAANK